MTGTPRLAEMESGKFHRGPEQAEDQSPAAALFGQLLDASEPERNARLATLEREDPALAAELRALLSAGARAGDFLAILTDLAGRKSGADSALDHLTQNRRIGPYLLERELGRGGMGVVWLAEDTRLDRKVALKLFVAPPGAGDPPESRGRMMWEARATARFDHPNVAAVHDVGQSADGIAYMAMTWCEGGSLAERLRTGPLPVEAAVEMAVQLAAALEAAHERGLLHRDVKPGNVLFDAAGRVRLGDFGIAMPLDCGDGRDGAAGTLAYASPEVLRDGHADARSDLWSLGVTLFEALTGVPPFRGGSQVALLHQIVAGAPALDASKPRIPRPLRILLDQLLHKDPSERPQSAREVRRRLASVQSRIRSHRPGYSPPVPLTPLIGRQPLLERASDLLEQTRLLTLTGPGGTGKTRLALALAGRHELRYDAGACFVPLASIPSADLIPDAIADAMGLKPQGAPLAVEHVLRVCGGATLLLVLDNCEHLPGAAPIIRTLLARSPKLQILCTSRGPLGVDGEQEFPVPPLELPAPSGLNASAVRSAEAVQLFIHRATARDPSFAVPDADLPIVASMVRRLDGLPLAIELAAARARTLGLAALLSKLGQSTIWLRSDRREGPARHRTLREAIGWSYDLLDPEAKRLFRALSVCHDPFRQELASWLSAEGTAADVSPLDALVEHGLIVVLPTPEGPARFGLLATIREFAREQLDAASETATVLEQHAEWFSAIAIAAAAGLTGPEQASWHARLREARHDIRASLAWLVNHGRLETAARMATALHRHWLAHAGYLREITTLLTNLEERVRGSDAAVDASVHAELLLVLGSLTGSTGTHQSIPHRHFEASLERYRLTGDQAGIPKALNFVGWSAFLLGRLDEAERASAEACALHRRRHDQRGVATSCINLGWVALSRASFAEAESRFSEALAIQRVTGDQRSISFATGHLATLALHRGDAGGAMATYAEIGDAFGRIGDDLARATRDARLITVAHEAMEPSAGPERLERDILPALRDAGHGWALGYALGVLAELRLHRGDTAGARSAAEESRAVRTRAGLRSGMAECEVLLGAVALRDGNRREAARHLAAGLAERLEMGERLAVIETVEAIAEWLLDVDPAAALTLCAGCEAARKRLGAGRTPRRSQRFEALDVAARRRCEAGTAERAKREGSTLVLDALARLAQHELLSREHVR